MKDGTKLALAMILVCALIFIYPAYSKSNDERKAEKAFSSGYTDGSFAYNRGDYWDGDGIRENYNSLQCIAYKYGYAAGWKDKSEGNFLDAEKYFPIIEN